MARGGTAAVVARQVCEIARRNDNRCMPGVPVGGHRARPTTPGRCGMVCGMVCGDTSNMSSGESKSISPRVCGRILGQCVLTRMAYPHRRPTMMSRLVPWIHPVPAPITTAAIVLSSPSSPSPYLQPPKPQPPYLEPPYLTTIPQPPYPQPRTPGANLPPRRHVRGANQPPRRLSLRGPRRTALPRPLHGPRPWVRSSAGRGMALRSPRAGG